ncbi:DUF4164 domain-containing protein [Candidatus Neoehrlichia procyonis]|uniref:Uncharacterized protein n=1 Tax=Candidatus Neoehrlichia procyonis str. RAC413 TaxID=1359163 RepID=A0A0F3NMU6_9RICK|nr:DUF4164 domain-containing protein [Candidatus Neoehrlichia lotoris]KJV69071.1 hypothetical protein NLO413_0447 [Candidatus Neoehrlichia lotoris str. RAC413]
MKNFDNLQYLEKLEKAFNKLEDYLIQNINNHRPIKTIQYEEAIKLLAIEKNKLEQQLLAKQQECDNWKATCSEVISKLNLSIETIQSIIKKEP